MKMIGKRILICLLVVVTMLASVPMSGFVGLELPKLSQLFAVKASAATEYKSGYYTYTVSGGKATITDVNDSISGSVTIPSKLGGYPVTEIGGSTAGDDAFDGDVSEVKGGFSNCNKMTQITIPSTITKIGHTAFFGCTSLTRVNINSIEAWLKIEFVVDDMSISANPLYHAEKLYLNGNPVTEVVVPTTVTTIKDCAFFNCTTIKSVKFHNGLRVIGYDAFAGCTSLKEAIIPDSAIVCDEAFAFCTSLENVVLSNRMNTVYRGTFAGCSNLKSVTIPTGVKNIGWSAFNWCDNLKTINYKGTRVDWAQVTVEDCNEALLNADINFTDSGSKLKLTSTQAVNIFMRHEDVWKVQYEITSSYYPYYGFLDLDFDGMPELVSTVNQGSGRYEYTCFYRIDPVDMRVKPIEVYTDGYYTEFAIDYLFNSSGDLKIIQNNATGQKMYFGCDGWSEGAGCYGSDFGILCNKNGKQYQYPLFGTYNNYYEAQSDETYYGIFDSNHDFKKVTKQKYSETVKAFWENNTNLNGKCSAVAAKTYHEASTQEQKRQYLLQSYCAFDYDGYENDDIIAEHYNFIKNNTTYSGRIKKANFAYEMASYQDDFQYKWFNLLSKIGLKFENYYDVALTELILSQTSAKKANEISQEYVGKQEAEITKGFISIITDLIDKYDDSCELKGTIEKNTIEKFVSGSLDKSSNSYKLLARFLNGKKVKPVFEKAIAVYDRSGTFLDIAGTFLDVVNNMIGVRNYICAVNAYISYNEYFKQMFVDTYKLVYNAGNKKLAQSMKKYINANSSVFGYAKECATAIREGKMKSCYDIFVGIFLKQTLSAVGTFAAGIKIAGTTVGALVSTKVAGCTIAGIASSVASGLSLGSLAGRLLTNSDEWMDSIGVVIPAGELSYYVKKVMLNYEKSFLKSLTEKNAFLFDSAFCFYNNLEIYACSHTIDAINGQKDSFALKWQKQKQLEADEAIKGTEEVLALHNRVKCHKTDLIVAQITYSQSVVYTGKKLAPQVKISDKIAGEDYTVTYDKNTDIGVGKIIITAKGGYTRGSVEKTFTIVPGRPQYIKALQTDQSTCSLLWSSVPGAGGYKVTVIDSKTNKALSSVAVKDNFVLLNGLKSNVKYLVKVKAYKKVEAKSYYGREISKAIQLSNACGITKLIARKSASAIKLAWNEVDGATGYRVYRYDSQKKRYIVLSDTTKAYYYDNTAKVGEPYNYAVKALQKCGKEIRLESNYKTVKYTLTLDAPVLNVTAGKGKVTLSWNKQSKATGYVIYMATSKSGKFSKIAVARNNATVTYTKTGLTKGRPYYFKVAAYATVGGKNHYSDFSAVKYTRAK